MRPPPPTLSSPSSPTMGNSEAKPGASSDGHAARAAAPPSSMASSTAQPRASPVAAYSSDGQATAAASPSSTSNPGAQPRASPIAPSSSSSSCDVSAGAAPPACPSPTSLAGSEAGETSKPPPEYPQRPGVADCSYYAKFGTCGYGIKCWFNHPPRPGGSQRQPSSSSLPRVHKSFSEKASNYNHPEGKIFVDQVKTNFLGLPLRPGAGLCSYYMKRGTCKFGTNCKYHHPDPKSEQVNSNALVHVDEESSEVKQAHNERHVPLVTSPTSGTSNFIPSRRKSTCTKRSAYKDLQNVGVSKDILELVRDIGVELADNDSNVGVPPSIQRGNLSDRDGVLMAVKGMLDKLTPEKFDLLKDQLIEAGITRDDILEDVITVLFEKAVSEPTFCPMYAQLCSYVNKKLPLSPPEEPDGKETAFTSVLLNNCHEVFEGAGNLCAEIDRLSGLDEDMGTRNKEIMLMKLRTLGNIRLIGELLKQKIITEKIAGHTVQMDGNKQGKPDWDSSATKVFCDICTVEVLAGNRPADQLNAIGYNNLLAKFNEKTKKGYNHEQFKSKWESLKKDYQTWKTLMESEDDLGQDSKLNTVSASPEWWAKKMEAMPECGKFRSAPLENVDLLNIMFEDMLDSSSTTPKANLAVNTTIESEHGAGDGNDIDIIDKDVIEQSKEEMIQKSSNKEPNSTKLAELNHLVNLDDNVNPRNPATSVRVDRVGSNISEIMELVVAAGVEEGSDEHFSATQLFIRPEYREMFLTLKTTRGRIGWLKKMCQVKE